MTDQITEPVIQQQEPLRTEQGKNWFNITNVRKKN